MEKEDVVSVWLGKAKTIDIVDQFVFMKYSTDGDLQSSGFSKYFSISRIDPDFTEIAFNPLEFNVPNLLEGISYEEQLLCRISADSSSSNLGVVNVGVLLYNYEHQNEVVDFDGEEISLRYVGSYEYEA